MSGGSMDYFYGRLSDVADCLRTNTSERAALKTHLYKVAKALKAIEWNDSGDGADDEADLIRAVLSETAILEHAVAQAREAYAELECALVKAERLLAKSS